MYYFFKSLIFTSFSLFLCTFSFLIGWALLGVIKSQRMGRVFIATGLFFLLAFSLPFLPDFFLRYLENQYPSLDESFLQKNITDVKYVVVLAASHVLDKRIPLVSQFSSSELVRLVEGVRLQRRHSGMKLLFSGGKGSDFVSDAELMAQLSMDLGIPSKDIILETSSRDTFDEVKLIQPIVQNTPFFLVTSASHMARSMALFRRQKMNPIPVPTGYLVKGGKLNLWCLIPNANNLMNADAAFYEYFAWIKEKLCGHI